MAHDIPDSGQFRSPLETIYQVPDLPEEPQLNIHLHPVQKQGDGQSPTISLDRGANQPHDFPRESEALDPGAAALAALAARDKLAQEALLDDPAAMRRQLPQLLNDMNIHRGLGVMPESLDLNDITSGLADAKLSQADKNLLTVFKAGFAVLGDDPSVSIFGGVKEDPSVISDYSLALVEKAVNRGLNENPYLSRHIWTDPLEMAGSAALMLGMRGYKEMGGGWQGLLGVAAAGAVGGAFGLGGVAIKHYTGAENNLYDAVQSDYKKLKTQFENEQAKPPAIQGS